MAGDDQGGERSSGSAPARAPPDLVRTRAPPGGGRDHEQCRGCPARCDGCPAPVAGSADRLHAGRPRAHGQGVRPRTSSSWARWPRRRRGRSSPRLSETVARARLRGVRSGQRAGDARSQELGVGAGHARRERSQARRRPGVPARHDQHAVANHRADATAARPARHARGQRPGTFRAVDLPRWSGTSYARGKQGRMCDWSRRSRRCPR